jgi:hypothetical protein
MYNAKAKPGQHQDRDQNSGKLRAVSFSFLFWFGEGAFADRMVGVGGGVDSIVVVS